MSHNVAVKLNKTIRETVKELIHTIAEFQGYIPFYMYECARPIVFEICYHVISGSTNKWTGCLDKWAARIVRYCVYNLCTLFLTKHRNPD